MKRFFIVLFLCAGGTGALAETKCVSAGSYRDLLECAEARSGEIQQARLEVERSRSRVDMAGQWENPELSAESFQGKVDGQSWRETDLSLSIPVEIGGKISARKDFARSGLSLAETKLFEARAQVRSQLLLKLHRLRQVIHEQEIADEAIQTFTKLIGQYAKRPGLSPEQQVASSVYQLSKSEYELKRSGLVEELAALDGFFRLHLDLSSDQVKGALPPSPKPWPQWGGTEKGRPSSRQRALEAELDAAKAELALARSESWPTLMIGPSVKMQTENGQSHQFLGVNLSFSLPVFHLNGGARSAAAAGVQWSKSRFETGMREQDLRREELRKVYEQTVRVLEGSLSHESIEQKHRDAERLFSRGVVPSSLVIEAHRTSFELEKTRHERELRALQALFEMRTMDGTLLEVD